LKADKSCELSILKKLPGIFRELFNFTSLKIFLKELFRRGSVPYT
jgi:hypothetical protein